MSANRMFSCVLGFLIAAALLVTPASARDRAVAMPSLPEVLTALETFAQSALAEEKVPGMAYAVVKDDQVVFAKGYGVKSVGVLSGPVTDHTVFEIGSTTKAFTATLLAMLVEQGKLSWDDRVKALLPDFAMKDEWVTGEMRVVDLLCQRSGMPPAALDSMILIGFGRNDIQKALVYVDPVSSFRNTYGYVNSLWIVAANVVQKAGGYTWEDAMNLNIFGPLGMRETTVDPEVAAAHGDVAIGHLIVAGSATPIPAQWQFRTSIDVIGPAASIRSSLQDMTRWARLHLARGELEGVQILKPETVDLLHSARTYVGMVDGAHASYALGWIREERAASTIVWHNGATFGQHSIVALYPAANVGLVVLTNSPDNKLPERMKDKLFELMFPASVGMVGPMSTSAPPEFRSERTVPVEACARALAPVPPLPLSRYTGVYSNPAYGDFTVQEKSGGIVMIMGPRKVEATLLHYSGNIFTLTWPDMLNVTSRVAFIVKPGQPAEAFIGEQFSDVSGGWFKRRSAE